MELACREVVFHFNKKHLEDPTIPMWVVKTKGKTYYVEHVTANIPWSTKETPDNASTKGSIKFKNVLLTIEDNEATLSELTFADRIRLSASLPVRILFSYKNQILWFLKENEIEHGECRMHRGSCGSRWYVLEIAKEDLTMLAIAYTKNFRILQENEYYYEHYEKGELAYLDTDYQGTIEKLSNIEEDELEEDGVY